MKAEQFYLESRSPLTEELFTDPPAIYRGAPFWSWNCRLETGRVIRQLDALFEMGLGGGHIHSRAGLATPYLGPEFMDCVKACVEHAAQRDKKIWLYDEDRWPSGFAGGIVTKEKRYRQRALLFSPQALTGMDPERDPQLLARYSLSIEKEKMTRFERLSEGEEPAAGRHVWSAYRVLREVHPAFNNETYVDTMSREAIERFIAVTHEAFKEAVGEHFGKTIPSIFTDEPQISFHKLLDWSSERGLVALPWTDDLPDTYRAVWNEDLLDLLPLLVFESAEEPFPAVRWRFRDHVTERFAEAFADTIGEWCGRYGIASTGHMMEEPTLESQTRAIGEAMRHYRGFQLPGIDMLCDRMELTTAKQAQSAARQDGRPGVMSELYGVTNWDFPFSGHKRQGDWQAALGVTVRVHHLTWVSMAANAKRDYPASMGPHVPWYREYPYIENHFARLNTILTRGRPVVKVAVVHPIESYWLSRGPTAQCKGRLEGQEKRFEAVTRWLLEGLIDFDYLCESRLVEQGAHVDGDELVVGAMRYRAVVVPPLLTIRSTTCDLLEELADAGGKVLWTGGPPAFVDALPSPKAAVTAVAGSHCEFEPGSILSHLEPERLIDARDQQSAHPPDLLYQLREEEGKLHLFVCCTREDFSRGTVDGRVRIRGEWKPVLNDSVSGRRGPLPHRHVDGWTEVPFERYHGASLCLTLEAAAETVSDELPEAGSYIECARLADPVPVTLLEPNVLLLDQAEYRLQGDAEWQPADDLLFVTNYLRERLEWPPNKGKVIQPWVAAEDPREAVAELRFRIDCRVPVAAPELVLERAVETTLFLNDQQLVTEITGWWVDEDLERCRLPDLPAGVHELVIRQPISPVKTLEWCYLLGDFGVEVAGRHARIVKPVRELAWGDITCQGLPFYGGSLTYHARLEHPGGSLFLRLPWLKSAAVTVDLDGERAGIIALDPFRLDLGELESGEHRLDLTVLGTRINSFGQVHNQNPHCTWWGPPSWEAEGIDRTLGYVLRSQGILSEPVLESGE